MRFNPGRRLHLSPMNKLFNNLLKSNLTIFLILGILGFSLYSLILHAPFKTMDDYYAIILNSKIKSFQYVGEILRSSFFGENSYYRPLVYLSFMIEYHFFKLDSFFYNLTNVLLHVGS